MKIIFIIYKHLNSDTEWMLISENTYILNSNLNQRAAAFIQFPDSWLCFFDHDCLLDEKLKNIIEQKILSYEKHWILAGLYKNPDSASILQMAHNFVCNEWVLQHTQNDSNSFKNFLGGFFAVYSNEIIRQIDYSNLPDWGAEDQALAFLLQKHNFIIQIEKNIFVEHQTSKKIQHFIRRAYRQGINATRYDLAVEKNRRQKINFWNQKLKSANWKFRYLIYFHFLILISAMQFQKLRPKHNLK